MNAPVQSLLIIAVIAATVMAMPVEFINLTLPASDERIQLVDDGTFSLLPNVSIPVRFVVFLPATSAGGAKRVTEDEARSQLRLASQIFNASGMGNVSFALHSVQNVVDAAALASCNTRGCLPSSVRRRGAAETSVGGEGAASASGCPFYSNTIPRYQAPAASSQAVINVFVCPNIAYDGESQFPWEQQPVDYFGNKSETSATVSIPAYIQLKLGSFFNHGNGTARNLGKALVHELGHFFGLLHVFDSGGNWSACDPLFGDFVDDTPPTASGANPALQTCRRDSGCPGVPERDVGNVMDVGADACLTHFTPLQVRRMALMLRAYRPKLVMASRADGVRHSTLRAANVNATTALLPPMRQGFYFIGILVPVYLVLIYCYARRTRQRILVPGRDV